MLTTKSFSAIGAAGSNACLKAIVPQLSKDSCQVMPRTRRRRGSFRSGPYRILVRPPNPATFEGP
ncbi:hypothetical protein AB0N17_45825, partial [Streptomyces sp. NPDC051133]|uniref:hypothetical protein n=1 Tax=Streptomyces sp. NPDC051133 TaxID=3155521 RepID=UPI00341A7070